MSIQKILTLKFSDLPEPDKVFPLTDSLGGFEMRELRNRNIAFNSENRKNLYYPFYINKEAVDENNLYEISIDKVDGWIELWPKESQGYKTVWRWGKDKSLENLNINIKAKPMENGSFQIIEKYRAKSKMARSVWNSKEDNTEKGTLRVKKLFNGKKIFNFPKSVDMLKKTIEMATSNNDYVMDFFAGSGSMGEAVMNLNFENKESNRKFILVQIPQSIDPKEQKEAYRFVTEDLGKPATIFEITAERLRRAGAEIEAKQATQPEETKPVDTGFRVFDIIEDTNALILQKPLSEATQDDLDLFIEQEKPSINNGGDLRSETSQVLYNLLLAEGLPLTTAPIEVIPQKLYLAQNVAIILSAIDLTVLKSNLENLKTADTPATYLTVYAPWVHDDNFMQGIKTLAESLGYSSDKLRLRGFGA